MIVDTSAPVAIALDEPDAAQMLAALESRSSPRISAANLLETFMVTDRRRSPRAPALLDAVLERVALTTEPVTEAQVKIARDAFHRYGKGSGHPAQLNFGDCFAYARARSLNEPLLFIGDDFGHTDIVRAARP